jgi:hypothetical protein
MLAAEGRVRVILLAVVAQLFEHLGVDLKAADLRKQFKGVGAIKVVAELAVAPDVQSQHATSQRPGNPSGVGIRDGR